MMFYLRSSAIALAGVLVLGALACGDRETAPVEPVKSEEEIRLEQEAARRAEETAALADRVSGLVATAGDLGGRAGSGALPESLGASVRAVQEKSGEVERLLAELQAAGADQWEAVKSRLDAALAELESASSDASAAVQDWRSREAAVLTAREEGDSPIDAESGLIQGLDGGDYEPYKDSVIERVQTLMREQGRYAGPVDGRLDRHLMEALGSFQQEHELQVSGVPSPMTRSRLFG